MRETLSERKMLFFLMFVQKIKKITKQEEKYANHCSQKLFGVNCVVE